VLTLNPKCQLGLPGVAHGDPAYTSSIEEPMTPEREERLQKEREERAREERIRLRALEIWREQGRPDWRAREHWEQAEREVGGNDGSRAGDDRPTR
jgi:hypothetical protein